MLLYHAVTVQLGRQVAVSHRFGHLHPHRASFIGACNSTKLMDGPEGNSDEYEMVLKYIRIYPDDYADKTKYRVAEILQAFKRLSPNIATDKSAISLLTKALKRRKIPFESCRNGSHFCCYVLTAEQAEYIEQQRDSTQVLDLEYDKYVPLEILLAHREATIRDLYKANEILIHSDEDFEKAKQMYHDYLSYERGNFTTENDLTIF